MTDQTERGREIQAREASGAPRVFVDVDGVRWHVHEQPFSEYDRRKGRSLIFASEGAVRRVRDYPEDWMSLTDDALADLSWKA
jgi:hypothetical protein